MKSKNPTSEDEQSEKIDPIELLYIEAPSIGLVEFRKRIESIITSQRAEAKKNGFYMACGLCGVEESKVESLWDMCSSELAQQQSQRKGDV